MKEEKINYPFKVIVRRTHKIVYENTYEFSEEKAKSDQRLIDCIRKKDYSCFVEIINDDRKIMPNNVTKLSDDITHICKKIIDSNESVLLDEQ